MKYFFVLGRMEDEEDDWLVFSEKDGVFDLDTAARRFASIVVANNSPFSEEEEDYMIYVSLVLSVESELPPEVLSDEAFLGSPAFTVGEFMS